MSISVKMPQPEITDLYKSEEAISSAGFYLPYAGKIRVTGGLSYRWANLEMEVMARLEEGRLHISVAQRHRFMRIEPLCKLLALFFGDVSYYITVRPGDYDMHVLHAYEGAAPAVEEGQGQ